MDAHLLVVELLHFRDIVENALQDFGFGRSWSPFALLRFGDLFFDDESDASVGLQMIGSEYVEGSDWLFRV